jgi:sialic acid synthase SpsE
MKLSIISEIGINHNGDFRLIEELVRQSKSGGADFAKFQLYDSVRVFGDESRKKNEFTFNQVKDIKDICDTYGIEFFASVFDEEKLQWCLDLNVKNFKVASRTLVKEPDLFEKIIKTGINSYVSLGMWKEDLLLSTLPNVFYFNCISKYPTSINYLSEHQYYSYDNRVVGLSDHGYGISNCLYHIALGANVIEKHFTLNKSSQGNDHIGSMDLKELCDLRRMGDEILICRNKTKELKRIP